VHRWAIIVLFLSLTAVGACGSNSGEPRLDTVFSGFELLDKRAFSSELEAEFASPVVRTAEQRPARIWSPGYVNLMRKSQEFDDEELALSIIPSRLSTAGATIVRAPRSPSDLMTMTVGGPLFRIEFDWKRQRGIIYDRPARVDERPEELLLFELR